MKKQILLLLFTSLIISNNWVSNISEKYSEAVVHIVNIQNGEPTSFGSGFIVDKKGVIVTNFHVIDNAEELLVRTKDEEEYEVKGYYIADSKKDYAIIRISGFDLPTVKLGNSKYVKIGEEVLAIGHPRGLSHTVTNGIISQIRKNDGVKTFQINAAIDHGSSGGPLFNNKGEVIGITTSGFQGEDFNFAIPINYINGELGDLPTEYLSIVNNRDQDYSNEYKDFFISNCMNDANNLDLCQCAYSKFTKSFPYPQLLEENIANISNSDYNLAASNIAIDCSIVGYGQEFKRDFISECISEIGDEKICECTYPRLVSRYPYPELLEENIEKKPENEVVEQIQEVFLECFSGYDLQHKKTFYDECLVDVQNWEINVGVQDFCSCAYYSIIAEYPYPKYLDENIRKIPKKEWDELWERIYLDCNNN